MKKKISERMMTSKQQVTQMNHYWKDLDHRASDDMKKKNMDNRFGIKISKWTNMGILYRLTSINEDNLKMLKLMKHLLQKLEIYVV